MRTISRDELQELFKQDVSVAVVDVLPKPTFRKYHLPGAKNVPLDEGDFDEAVQQAVPDKDRTVVVYCMNTECPLSARAARRMDALGYQDVADYEEGKEGWRNAGLPIES